MVQESIITNIQCYLRKLAAEGIHAKRGILFGSFAKNTADQWSDIDLIVIAPEFDHTKEDALVKRLWRATLGVDDRIDPIPCGEREWETEQGSPLLDIARQEGVAIQATPES
jgi:uncharacterized protein